MNEANQQISKINAHFLQVKNSSFKSSFKQTEYELMINLVIYILDKTAAYSRTQKLACTSSNLQ